MKRLTCEMCGSTDLVKQDGLFVCQVCGCKYSAEEAKKMMVEGTVEIVGTVKVDKSEELQKLYVIARRARQDNNSENAQKYYEQILVKDPESWEANFYAVYYQSMNCKIGEIRNAADRLRNCEISILKLINTIEDKSEKMSAVKEVSESLIKISKMLFFGSKNHYEEIDSGIRAKYIGEYAYNCKSSLDILYNYGNNVVNILGSEYTKEVALPCWKEGIELHKILIQTVPPIYINEDSKSIIQEYVKKIHKFDNSYKDEKFERLILNIGDGSSSSSYYEEILQELSDFSCYDETAEYVQQCENYYKAAIERESIEKKKAAEEQRIKDEKAAEKQRIKDKKAKEQLEKTKKILRKIFPIVTPCVVIIILLAVIIMTVVIPNNKYNTALDRAENKQYEEALDIFETIKGYKDSQEQIYNIAKILMKQENYGRAAIAFGRLDNYSDAYTLALEAWQHLNIKTLDAGYAHTVGVNVDGTVVAIGHNSHSQCKVDKWTDIVSVYCGHFYTLGLKIDGTVVATGLSSIFGNESGFIQVAGGDSHRVALSYDGTVAATGDNTYGQCDVSEWTDIVYISCGNNYTIGVKSDGTVVACGDNEDGQGNVSNWKNIVSVACGYSHTVGLTSSGVLYACGSNVYGETQGSEIWHLRSDRNAKAVDISCAAYMTAVLYSDGTADGCGKGSWYRLNDWTDLVSIACSANEENIYGLCSDGSILIAGNDNDYGQNNVNEWSTIRTVSR